MLNREDAKVTKPGPIRFTLSPEFTTEARTRRDTE
jgi:hypothetical protein